jgi:hypothetical protein
MGEAPCSWIHAFWSKNILPTDILPTNILHIDILVYRHLDDWHFAIQHLTGLWPNDIRLIVIWTWYIWLIGILDKIHHA